MAKARALPRFTRRAKDVPTIPAMTTRRHDGGERANMVRRTMGDYSRVVDGLYSPTGGCHNRLAGRFASQEVYIAMHLNGDIASGRPGATSYRADFRLERIDLPNLRWWRSCVPRSVAEDSNNYLQPAMSRFDVVTSTVIFVNYYEVL